MCVGCGGACEDEARTRGARFITQTTGTHMEIVGSAGGVDHIPDALITQRGGMVTYETLYTTLDAGGQPAAATIPGTFGNYATRARLERGR